ncbi:lectin 2 [Lactarius akahatsu]|uniref:Lectin 2 n=1 Tax=Lactarius akahatsu TaxID=416441 RepID=A0AAD4Q8M7_9AGAM|nr:lectin 2 [Lactarius akahatsu]
MGRSEELIPSQDKMAIDQDCVDLGVLCVSVCDALKRATDGKKLEDLNGFVLPALRAGLADIVDFGQDGVVILRNGFNTTGYNAGGSRIEEHVRLVGDVTGDGADDLVEFGEAGVLVSTNNGDNTFTSPVKLVLKDFGYDAGGWRVEKHIRYLADIRGVGRSDIVGFGHGGVIVSKNDGNAKFNPVYLALGDFGLPHRVARRNNGDGTFAPAQAVISGTFCYDGGGWRIEQHPRFIADLTGDGKVDIIGCGDAGVYVSLNKGDGTFGPINLVANIFGTVQGWKVDKHPRFIADLTGDKRGDIIGFGEAGVYVAYNNGNGTFQPGKLVLSDFGVQQGWQVNKHPRFVVDLTGDGRADILGFRENSVFVAYNDGKGGFPSVKTSVDKTVRWLANLDQASCKIT